MRYNRLLPIIIPLLIFGFLELIGKKADLVYVSGSLIVILNIFAVRQFLVFSKTGEKWWDLAVLPVMNSIGVIMFSLFAPRSLNHLIFFLNLVINYFYYRILYYYLIEPEKYAKNSLENLSSYSNFISFYFLASAVYGLQILLDARIWILVLLMMLAAGAMFYETLWANGLINSLNGFYVFLICLSMVEIAWSISFLSLPFYVLGMILAVCYYVLAGLTKHYLLGIIDRRLVKLYLLFGFASIAAVLLTARWL